MVGRDSISGSNRPRVRPTATFASLSRWATSAKRAVSAPSRPSALTLSAPSKLSWATAETSPRKACARITNGDMCRWKMVFAIIRAGSTAKPIRASTGSAAIIATAPTINITATPSDIGSGANTCQVASTSAFAVESNCPAGWR